MNISNNLTLIMVSHRYSTLFNCDRILEVDKGVIVADGPPNEILNLKNKNYLKVSHYSFQRN